MINAIDLVLTKLNDVAEGRSSDPAGTAKEAYRLLENAEALLAEAGFYVALGEYVIEKEVSPKDYPNPLDFEDDVAAWKLRGERNDADTVSNRITKFLTDHI